MKILCVADHRSPIVYSTGIKERFKEIDLVLGAGDLPMDYYGYIVSSLNKKLFFCFRQSQFEALQQIHKCK